ncbi:MAG: hypothetical protein LBB21_00270 [Holosporaceae bacterium]|jgi:predicted helicase|nr:hypothetical protein [Holosporaceae bacterium]
MKIVIGNPPYSVSSQNKGKQIIDLLNDYKKDLNEKNIKALSDDYIKFIRFGQYQVEKNGEGILAYVCNNGFLDGIIYRQMRKTLLDVFDKIYVLNLHGNARKKETCADGSKDENVFNVMVGISIVIFIKTNKSKKHADVFYHDLYGTHEKKYDFLSDAGVCVDDFSKLAPVAPHYFFVPKDFSNKDEYDKGFGMRELFITGSIGIKTKNDTLAISYSSSELTRCLSDFRSMPEDELISKYPKMTKESGDWKRKKFLEDAKNDKGKIIPIAYRPFDIRFTYYTGKANGFMCRPCREVMRHMMMENISVIANRGFVPKRASAFISKHVNDIRVWSSPGMSGIDYCFPLYTYSDNYESRQPNFHPQIIEKFAKGLKLKFVPEKINETGTFAPIDVFDYIYAVLHSAKYCEKYREFLKIDFPKVPYPTNQADFWELVAFGGRLRRIHLLESEELDEINTFAPIDVFDYIYAVLHSAKYCEKYSEFLKIDFPKVPYPTNQIDFWKLVKLGSRLRRIHLLESEELDEIKVNYPVSGDNVVHKVIYSDNKVYINDSQYFNNVPDIAWNFYIGGYQPAQKWLKDRRGRQLNYDDIEHYQKIINALYLTDKIMKEIDSQ